MSSTATSTSIDPHHADRSIALRRAIRLDLALHRDFLLGAAAISVLLVLAAVFANIELGFVVLLLGLYLPAEFASKDQDVAWRGDRDQLLRSTLRVSRADTARSRTVLIAAGQVIAILLVTVIVIVNRTTAAADLGTGLVHDPGTGAWGTVIDPLTFAAAMIWSHAMVGGQALRFGRRFVFASALGTFIAVHIVVTVASLLAAAGTLLATRGSLYADTTSLSMTVAGAVPLLALLVAVLLLLRRSRRWARGA